MRLVMQEHKIHCRLDYHLGLVLLLAVIFVFVGISMWCDQQRRGVLRVLPLRWWVVMRSIGSLSTIFYLIFLWLGAVLHGIYDMVDL